ncbi:MULTISPECIES: hypothetical protein [unclassified Prosthecochloris]|uniref:hypothetical protein n=1 Tax=unclassified Prosthecochloris TaxID=2632826 RepID=UPI00223CF343|nr:MULTISPECIES: hypothetical protein [unclassified Prosthecochloris]UZJ38131.1 hypothetical protein OO005_02700 [Prosthecochloris sp. SCSIO W1103]UZJ41932.1 hypothetical protein OO006_02740 [Prosthecochloris sp. SCSIO W1101]
MKKIVSLLAAVAIFGMGSVAMADLPSYNGVDATSGVVGGFYAFTSIEDQCLDYGEDMIGGGIEGDFYMEAYSDADYVVGANQWVGSGAELYGEADLDLDGVEDEDACPGCAPCDDIVGMAGGSLSADMSGASFSGYGENTAWASTNTLSVVTGSGDTSGSAGIGGYSRASNGFVGAWSGGWD